MSKDHEYRPLMSDPSDEIERTVTLPPMKSITWTSIFSRTVLVGLLLIETLGLATAMLFLFHRVHPTTCTTGLDPNQLLYSPALVAVENEVRVYNIGFPGDLSSFQIPSSPALDQMWSDLYNFGISRISKDEAARLPNKTHAIPGDEGYYIAELDVFHNLHCLNKVRMALDPDYYPEWRISTTNNWIPSQKNATEHVSHCLDWIRQSIMCAGDTSVIVWQWEDSANASIVKGDVAHTCRNFDRLRDWGHEHTLHVEYDPAVHIEDDIAVPTFRSGGEQQRG